MSQNDTINQIDSLGRKQGHWIYFGKDRPSEGYPAEGKIEEGPYLNDRKSGTWKKYYNDGITLKMSGEYVNNRPIGTYAKYYLDGTFKETGCFSSNKYCGVLKRYHENGQLWLSQKYNDEGEMIDTVVYYYQNGCLDFFSILNSCSQPIKTIRYQVDSCNVPMPDISRKHEFVGKIKYSESDSIVPISPTNSSYQNESLRESAEWNQGQYDDSNLCTDSKREFTKNNELGECIYKGTCKDRKVWNGKMIFYDSDGIQVKIEHWKKGVYFGIADCY